MILRILPKASLQNIHFFGNLLFIQKTCPPAPLLPSDKTFGGDLVRAEAEATSPPKNVKGKISHDITFQGPRTVSTGMANGFQPKWPLSWIGGGCLELCIRSDMKEIFIGHVLCSRTFLSASNKAVNRKDTNPWRAYVHVDGKQEAR